MALVPTPEPMGWWGVMVLMMNFRGMIHVDSYSSESCEAEIMNTTANAVRVPFSQITVNTNQIKADKRSNKDGVCILVCVWVCRCVYIRVKYWLHWRLGLLALHCHLLLCKPHWDPIGCLQELTNTVRDTYCLCVHVVTCVGHYMCMDAIHDVIECNVTFEWDVFFVVESTMSWRSNAEPPVFIGIEAQWDELHMMQFYAMILHVPLLDTPPSEIRSGTWSHSHTTQSSVWTDCCTWQWSLAAEANIDGNNVVIMWLREMNRNTNICLRLQESIAPDMYLTCHCITHKDTPVFSPGLPALLSARLADVVQAPYWCDVMWYVDMWVWEEGKWSHVHTHTHTDWLVVKSERNTPSHTQHFTTPNQYASWWSFWYSVLDSGSHLCSRVKWREFDGLTTISSSQHSNLGGQVVPYSSTPLVWMWCVVNFNVMWCELKLNKHHNTLNRTLTTNISYQQLHVFHPSVSPYTMSFLARTISMSARALTSAPRARAFSHAITAPRVFTPKYHIYDQCILVFLVSLFHFPLVSCMNAFFVSSHGPLQSFTLPSFPRFRLAKGWWRRFVCWPQMCRVMWRHVSSRSSRHLSALTLQRLIIAHNVDSYSGVYDVFQAFIRSPSFYVIGTAVFIPCVPLSILWLSWW